jgi:serine/threonine-protein kinase
MSPEQAGGTKIGPQTDIFSLGVVLYELLTGIHPFQAKTMPALFKNIVSEDPVPLKTHRKDLPPALQPIISKALQKEPEDRYASCAEFAADLIEVELELETFGEDLSSEHKLEILSRLKFFNDFSEDEIEEVLDQGEWEAFPLGKDILIEGEQDKAFYVITSGNASVSRMNKEIATLGEGDCFGEMAWLLGGKRSATVTAITKTVVLKLDEPLADWASLSCQMRVNKTVQRVLMERLNDTTKRYARAL